MVSSKVNDLFERYYNQRKFRVGIKIAIVGLSLTLYLVSSFLFTIMSLEQNLLLLVVLIIASLEAAETHLYDIKRHFEDQTRVYRDYVPALDSLNDYIDETDAEDAYMLVYSSGWNNVQSTIENLIRNRANIYLLMKEPTTTINRNEEELTFSALTWLWEFHEQYDSLQIRFYSEQGSVMGFKIDDRLQLGWYTYDQQGDRVVWGHKNPVNQFSSQDVEQYQIMNQWFCNHYYSLWSNGITPMEFYERESGRSDDTHDGKMFVEWVETDAQNIATRRENWLETVSTGEYADEKEMFTDYF